MNVKRERDWTSDAIKVGAILTATPRIVVAMLRADGFEVPVAWVPYWIPISAVLSVGLAFLEGVAFAYLMSAYRTQRDKTARNIIWMAVLSAVLLVAVVSPSIAATIPDTSPLGRMLPSVPLRLLWSAAVVLASVTIVGSVGYSQRSRNEPASSDVRQTARVVLANTPEARTLDLQARPSGAPLPLPILCWCGAAFEKPTGLANHQRVHVREVRELDSAVSAHLSLQAKYPAALNVPSVAEVAKLRMNGQGGESA